MKNNGFMWVKHYTIVILTLKLSPLIFPRHDSCHGRFVLEEDCIRRKFIICFFPAAVQRTLFYRTASLEMPYSTFKQALHFVRASLDRR